MGNYILDMMIDARRLHALQRICRAFKPSVPVDYVMQELSFENAEEGEEAMRKAGCILEYEVVDNEGEGSNSSSSVRSDDDLNSKLQSQLHINTKDSVIDMSVAFTQNKLLL